MPGKALSAIVCIALMSSCATTEKPARTYKALSDIQIRPGQRLPKFVLPDASGNQISSDSFAGKVTVISFFTEGCTPCLHEIPALNAFKSAHTNFNVVAISPDKIDDAKHYPAKYHFLWPVVANGEDYVFNTLGVKAFPSFAVLDENGELLATTYGNQLDSDHYVSEKGLSAWVNAVINLKDNTK